MWGIRCKERDTTKKGWRRKGKRGILCSVLVRLGIMFFLDIKALHGVGVRLSFWLFVLIWAHKSIRLHKIGVGTRYLKIH